jgi:hypothetical protein
MEVVDLAGYSWWRMISLCIWGGQSVFILRVGVVGSSSREGRVVGYLKS